jgi:hypothetical protein
MWGLIAALQYQILAMQQMPIIGQNRVNFGHGEI